MNTETEAYLISQIKALQDKLEIVYDSLTAQTRLNANLITLVTKLDSRVIQVEDIVQPNPRPRKESI